VLLDAAHAIKTETPYHSHLLDHLRVQQVKLFPQMGTIVVQLDSSMTPAKLGACH
jgi:hypothetical protein